MAEVTDWRRERSLNGGADRIPLPSATGGLWLCGKHFIGPDPEIALRKTGATTVVCLSQIAEIVPSGTASRNSKTAPPATIDQVTGSVSLSVCPTSTP